MDEQQTRHAYCYKILQIIGLLHSRGYQRLRIFPYARGMWWRCDIAPGELFDRENGACMESHPSHDREGLVARFSDGDSCYPFGWKKSIAANSLAKIASLFLERFPVIAMASLGSDWAYAGWYQEMLMRTSANVLPIAFYRDEYEQVVHDPLRFFRIDQTVNGPVGGSMPLPPRYQSNESVHLPEWGGKYDGL